MWLDSFKYNANLLYISKNSMNSKIFSLITKNLHTAFSLPKYAKICIDENTVVDALPWTPARYRKFKDAVEAELCLPCEYRGTLKDIVEDLDQRYLRRFFGEIWKPRTDDYTYSGWTLVEEVQKHNPQKVLDVGCGYHPFKGRIPNIVGIDPYNDQADYMVDILDFNMHRGDWDAIIALGSINFNSRDDIEKRFAHAVDLLAPGGRLYVRANPGIQWKNGPYVEIFAWSFDVLTDLVEKYHLKLETFKQESAIGRLYFVCAK